MDPSGMGICWGNKEKERHQVEKKVEHKVITILLQVAKIIFMVLIQKPHIGVECG